MQKAMAFGENAVRILSSDKGVYDTGKQIYETGSAAAPYVSQVAGLLL